LRHAPRSFDVRIWGVSKYKGKRGTSYTVRWRVQGERHQRTFTTAKLADSFRSELTIAARDGRDFDPRSGLPTTLAKDRLERTWYEHAVEFIQTKWPHVAPRHRKGLAQALAAVTLAFQQAYRRPAST